MLDHNWQDLFAAHILLRGANYADNGCVNSLRIGREHITAVVRGSTDYKVTIDLENGKAAGLYCSCPYAEDGSRCKHMAAVLFEAEKYFEAHRDEEMSEISDLLEAASREDLITFLSELSWEDSSLANRIRASFSTKPSESDMKELKREADQIFRMYKARGYMNYHEVSALQMDLDEFLIRITDALMDQKAYYEAFEISEYVFEKMCEIIGDDDDQLEGITETCRDIWRDVIAACTEKEREEIEQWFKEHAYEEGPDDYWRMYIQAFYEAAFASEKILLEEIERLDTLISSAGQSTNCPDTYSTFDGPVPAVKRRMELMKKLGATDEEVEKYRYDHRNFQIIRKEYVEEAEKSGNLAKLISLLNEGKKFDAIDHYLVWQHCHKLAEIFHKTGNREKERDERYEMFTLMHGGNIEAFRLIKSLCSDDEWPKFRDNMISATESKSVLCDIYAEEKMTDELYPLVFENADIPTLDKYGAVLADRYSAEILPLYEKHVRKIADHARNRAHYEKLTDSLTEMLKYNGGKELAKKLSCEWIAAYPTRKQMVRELEWFLEYECR